MSQKLAIMPPCRICNSGRVARSTRKPSCTKIAFVLQVERAVTR